MADDLDLSGPASPTMIDARAEENVVAPRDWFLVIGSVSLLAAIACFAGGGGAVHGAGYALACIGVFVPVTLWRRQAFARQNQHGIAPLPRTRKAATALLYSAVVVAFLHSAFWAGDLEPYVSRFFGIES